MNRLVMPKVVDRYHALAPICAPCSAKLPRAGDGVPMSVPVERALIIRDIYGAHVHYLAICHCHSEVAIVHFGESTPTDHTIKRTKVF